MYKRLYGFVEPILYNKQFGFRSKRSTTHAVTELCTDIIESVENKEVTMATFLDLSKAFDTIDHDILIKKLLKYGLRGVALDWFKSYLTDRKQFVQYKSHPSPLRFITNWCSPGKRTGSVIIHHIHE